MSTKKEKSIAAPAGESVAADIPVAGTEKTAGQRNLAALPKKSDHQMYLGPTIPGVVRYSTVFKGGILPLKAEKCVEQLPIMKQLFVPLGEVPKAVRALNQGTSVLDAVCDQVNQAFNGKAFLGQ